MKREIQVNGVIPNNEAGFKKGRGTMDNVCIHWIHVMFVDFRIAFDKTDREKMCECLRERGISEWLVRKIEEIYARIKNKVKVREKEGECFGRTKAVIQGSRLVSSYLRYMWQIWMKCQ
jgi:hypothetical protein